MLAKHSPSKYAPLIFSIKQTGVPVGGQFAVVAAWLLVQDSQPETWTRAFMATAIICLALAVIIHPMRKRFDADRNPGHPVRFSDAIRNVSAVLRSPALRDLCLAMFAFVGLQGLFNSIFATYAQAELGYAKDTALRILFGVNLLAAAARIFWGWIGSEFIPARAVLAVLAFVMAAATIGIGIGGDWPYWALVATALVFGATALSWHGLLLSEVARLAPPGQVGPITGGVLLGGALGMLSFPFIAKTLRDFGVSYEAIFVAAAVPACIVGFKILRPAAPEPSPRPPAPVDGGPRQGTAAATAVRPGAAPEQTRAPELAGRPVQIAGDAAYPAAQWPPLVLRAQRSALRPGLGKALRQRRDGE